MEAPGETLAWQAEHQLQANFVRLVAAQALGEVAVTLPDYVRRHQPHHAPLEQFELVPMVRDNLRYDSRVAAGVSWTMPRHIREDYHWMMEGEGLQRMPPHLDRGFAVGLAFRGLLIAGIAACIEPHPIRSTPQLDIEQIQGFIRSELHPDYMPGLRGGLLWPDTLLRVWEHVGTGIGAPVIRIPTPRKHKYRKNYATLARRRDFPPEPVDGYWVKSLPRATEPSDQATARA